MMMKMEKLAKQSDMEVMKMAMLKHEETFKQQVHELHRLYRIQKQLMSDLNRSPEQTSRRRKKHPRRAALDLHLPTDDEHAVKVTPPPREDELALTLTLAVGGATAISRRKRREGSASFSGGASLTSSSSTDSDGAPYERAMAIGLKEITTTATAATVTQPPWLVQCLSLRMA